MRRALGGSAAALLLTGGLLSVAPAAQAATFTVDSGADTVGDCTVDGECTLRSAIIAANASPEADTITFDPAVTDVTLDLAGAGEAAAATGDLDVAATGAVTIDGGTGVTMDASALGDRAFDVLVGGTLTLTNVDVEGGDAPVGEPGGAIRSLGTLALTGGALTGNTGSAVSTGPGLSNGGGGAVFSSGTFTATGTEFTGNTALRAGGAIEVIAGSTTTLTDVVISTNTTTSDTGLPGNGGALHLTGLGTVTVIDSTVADNTAANEGGGLWNSAAGTMTVTATAVTNNTAAGSTPVTATDAPSGGGGLYNDGGTLTVEGGTIDLNDATGAAGSGGGILNVGGDLDVSGETQILANTSVRAGGGIEAAAVTGGTSTTTLDDVTLDGNTTGPTPGNGGGLHITGPGTVDVTGSTVTDNTAASEGGGLWNSAVAAMTVTDTLVSGNTAAGADATNGGGGLFNDGGTLVVNGGSVTDNDATGAAGSGGGIFNVGTLEVTGTDDTPAVITENTAVRAGGGIEAAAVTGGTSTTTLTGVDLSDNDTDGDPDIMGSPGNGGGLHITGGGTVDVASSDVTGNTAANEGGGLWNSGAAVMTVTDTLVQDNTAAGTNPTPPGPPAGGGGIYSDGGDLVVSESALIENSATGAAGSGGGILSVGATLTVSDTLIVANTAVRAGGGIEAAVLPAVETPAAPAVPSATTLTAVTLAENSTGDGPGNGGGLHQTGAGTVDVVGSLITENTATNEGGGLWNSAVGVMTVTTSTFALNEANGDEDGAGGGALYNDGGTLTVTNSTLDANTAVGDGGGVLTVGGTVGLTHVTVVDGDSGVAGELTLTNSVVVGNGDVNCTDDVVSGGGNVLGDGCTGIASDTTGVDDAQLGPLDDNGGPTPTRLPLTGSPVVEAGISGSLTVDQRGAPRPTDADGDGQAAPDAGAVEVDGVPPVPPVTPVPPVVPGPTPGGPGAGTPPGTNPTSPPARPIQAQPDYTG